MKPPFGIKHFADQFEIYDGDGDLVAVCNDLEKAFTVTHALDIAHGAAVDWSCGHKATSACAECWRELAQRATKLQEACDTVADKEPYAD